MTSEEFPAEPRFEAMAALHSVVSNGEHVGKIAVKLSYVRQKPLILVKI